MSEDKTAIQAKIDSARFIEVGQITRIDQCKEGYQIYMKCGGCYLLALDQQSRNFQEELKEM